MDHSTISSSSPQSSVPRKRFRLAVWAIVGVAAVAIGVFSYRYIDRVLALRRAESALQAALAKVDSAEPSGWQLQT